MRVVSVSAFVLLGITACATKPLQSSSGYEGPIAEHLLSETTPSKAPAMGEDTSVAPARKTELIYQHTPEREHKDNSFKELSFRKSQLQLDFVDAPVGETTRTIISELLGVPVAISDGVTGTISLTTPGRIPARMALSELNTVLEASNLSLTRTENGYLLRPKTDVNAQPLFTVRPDHVTPSQLQVPLRQLLPSEIEVIANDQIGALLFRNSQLAEQEIEELVSLFDRPSYADKYIDLYQLRHIDPNSLVRELTDILSAYEGSTQSSVSLHPLNRLEQLLVISPAKSQRQLIRDWVKRLDQPATGEEITIRYYIAKHAPAETLATSLTAAFNGMNTGGATSTDANRPSNEFRIVPEPQNNALIIRSTGSQYREIKTLLDQIDIRPAQVLVKATIAEVTLNQDLRFGVRWFFEDGKAQVGFSDDAGGAVAPEFPGLSANFLDGLDAELAVSTLSSVTDVSILSAPSILVQSNQTATLRVGDEVPIVTQQAQGTGTGDAPILSTVQLRQTGVILEVTPRINAENMVVLEINQEVSDVVRTITSGIDSPTIQQRQFTSTVIVENGGSVALGGLISESNTDTNSGVPGLKDVPLFGNLFRSKDQESRRTELIVFLEPEIIRSTEDNQRILRKILDELESLGSVPNLAD